LKRVQSAHESSKFKYGGPESVSNPRDYIGSALRYQSVGSQAGLVRVNNYTLEHNRIE
jgi:hypothetical protein